MGVFFELDGMEITLTFESPTLNWSGRPGRFLPALNVVLVAKLSTSSGTVRGGRVVFGEDGMVVASVLNVGLVLQMGTAMCEALIGLRTDGPLRVDICTRVAPILLIVVSGGHKHTNSALAFHLGYWFLFQLLVSTGFTHTWIWFIPTKSQPLSKSREKSGPRVYCANKTLLEP